MNSQSIKTVPRFMGVEGKKFLTVQFRGAQPPRAHILFIPPFGEEMNRCRSLVAGQSRRFARAGYSCTLIDFYGTGDSEGELSDVRLEHWYDNVKTVIETVSEEQPAPLIFWGLRMGALLALDYAAKFQPQLQSQSQLQDIILWQPVTSAKMYVTQILRQRVASLMVRELPAETTKEIRQRLADGEKIEVAGYTLGGGLLGDFEAIELAQMEQLCSGKIHWLEHVIEAGKGPGIPAQKAMAQLQQQNNSIDLHTFSDPQIWQIHERDFAPQLLALTAGLLA